MFEAIWQLRRSSFRLPAQSCAFIHFSQTQMIRRNPTLIALGDADIQDVRSMLSKKQAESLKGLNSTANLKGKQGPTPQPSAAAVHVTDEAKRRREAREERLGITH